MKARKIRNRTRRRTSPSRGQPPTPPPGPDDGARAPHPGAHGFPIVGIGASAGGLDAFISLLSHLPATTGMAFVLVQHLDPKHESKLTELLAKATRMPVTEATDGLTVGPDCVYVIPPNVNMAIVGGVLKLTPRGGTRLQHLPVDFLFRSLANDRQAKAIGVILSGTGSDGALGLAEIKAVGGITFAQDERTAKFTGMPLSAVASGSVDCILPPEAIAGELARMGHHPYLAPAPPAADSDKLLVEEEDDLKAILALLQSTTGVDFSQYRDTTIRRRIMRRMVVHGARTLADYAGQLDKDRGKIEALYNDVLVNVTGFFRDPEVFEALKGSVFPGIVKTHAARAIRVWVPGCSMGQEAYSLAIALLEFLEDKLDRPSLQIFASDISDTVSLEKARAGTYPQSIEAEVSPDRLRRFFAKEDGGYRISRSIRDICVFAKQDVAADPPFSRVDLISCRNVLIYLGTALQRRIISTFHYALNPMGFLVLGASEAVGENFDLFEPVDRKHKIYSRRATAVRPHVPLSGHMFVGPIGPFGKGAGHTPTPSDFQREADRIVLGRYAPPGVLVNENMEILQFRGRTSPYLEPPVGEASFKLLRMARDNLSLELGTAIQEAKKQNASVRRQGVRVRDDRQVRDIHLEVIPVKLPGSGEGCFLVLFEEATPTAIPGPMAVPSAEEAGSAASPEDRDRDIDQLRRDLAAARQVLQSVTEQQDATNEELRSANEEILSSNEELQSTNEELETAKEELQSANEELTTVNEELQTRNAELNLLNNDLSNLLTSVRIPIVMLGSDLRIRRFNAAAGKAMNLIPADVGRPIRQLNLPLDLPDLDQVIVDVIGDVVVKEREVQDREGRWFALRIHPYRTADNKIEGAVLALIDIGDVKRAQERLQESADYARAIVETVREPLVILTADLRVNTANRSFYETFQVSPQETEGRLMYELGNGEWNIPRLRMLLDEIVPTGSPIQDFQVEGEFEHIGRRTMLLNARLLQQWEGHPERILLAIENITERKRAEEAMKEAGRHKDVFLGMLGHELRNPLAVISNAAQALDRLDSPGPLASQLRAMVIRQTQHLVRLVDDLLDVSRITSGKITLNKEILDLDLIVGRAVESTRPLIERRHHELTVSLDPGPMRLEADPTRLEQILVNLLQNAAKYTDPGGRIHLTVEREAGEAVGDGAWVVVRVRDDGVGIPPEMLPRVFEMFMQVDRSMERNQGGLGIGLTLAKNMVELHGGTIQAHSAGPRHGSEFVVRLPLASELQRDRAAEHPREDAQPVGASPRRRILVVDDNLDSAESLGVFLRMGGHNVRLVHDGPSAVEAAAAFQPDVVLLDIGLPGMHGYEVARRMREQHGREGIVLAALTGWGKEEDRRRAQEAGFDHYFVKPVDADALTACLTSLEVPRRRRSTGDDDG